MVIVVTSFLGATHRSPRLFLALRAVYEAMTSITFAVRGPVARDDLPGLSSRFRSLLADGRAVEALCEVRSLPADAIAVEALARLHLLARRRGCHIRLVGASRELTALVAFMGLEAVFARR
jgi:ABC-type transporter Mla MlaB component